MEYKNGKPIQTNTSISKSDHSNEHPSSPLLSQMQKDGGISFPTFRDALLLQPSRPTLASVFSYWQTVYEMDMAGDQSPLPTTTEGWKWLLAGGFAGGVSRTATAPLDRIRVLMVTGIGKPPLPDGPEKGVWLGRTGSVRGFVGAIKKIFKEGGIPGFYRGNGLNVIKV